MFLSSVNKRVPLPLPHITIATIACAIATLVGKLLVDFIYIFERPNDLPTHSFRFFGYTEHILSVCQI